MLYNDEASDSWPCYFFHRCAVPKYIDICKTQGYTSAKARTSSTAQQRYSQLHVLLQLQVCVPIESLLHLYSQLRRQEHMRKWLQEDLWRDLPDQQGLLYSISLLLECGAHSKLTAEMVTTTITKWPHQVRRRWGQLHPQGPNSGSSGKVQVMPYPR
jgi:hypothetical protein